MESRCVQVLPWRIWQRGCTLTELSWPPCCSDTGPGGGLTSTATCCPHRYQLTLRYTINRSDSSWSGSLPASFGETCCLIRKSSSYCRNVLAYSVVFRSAGKLPRWCCLSDSIRINGVFLMGPTSLNTVIHLSECFHWCRPGLWSTGDIRVRLICCARTRCFVTVLLLKACFTFVSFSWEWKVCFLLKTLWHQRDQANYSL